MIGPGIFALTLIEPDGTLFMSAGTPFAPRYVHFDVENIEAARRGEAESLEPILTDQPADQVFKPDVKVVTYSRCGTSVIIDRPSEISDVLYIRIDPALEP